MFNFLKKKAVTAATTEFGEAYWNNKYPQAPITYKGRTLKTSNNPIAVDVKNFVCMDDNILKDVLKKYKLVKPTANETALAVQKWVVKFLRYTDDSVSDKAEEFWQFPFETLASGVGDCEDGGILIASLLVNAGIPYWRVKVAAGIVQEAPTAPEGGHAYCVYLADRPDSDKGMEWVILDWCYLEDSDIPCEKKPLAKDGGTQGCYKNTWFTFNHKISWSQEKLDVDGRVK